MIDFITKIPRTVKQHDSIMVVVDKLTKATHFIPMKTTHKAINIEYIFIKEVAELHGVPKTIVSEIQSLLQIFGKVCSKDLGRI
jgi:hypothetical protein